MTGPLALQAKIICLGGQIRTEFIGW